MNKTKRTFIVSSIVMMLVLVIAIVSATAAWFSNYNKSEGDFTIDSSTVKESASIGLDQEVADYGGSIWPAVATKGYSTGNAFPYGQSLRSKSAKVEDATTEGIDKTAKCAVFYFPMACVGAVDEWVVDGKKQSDGRKSVVVSVESAKLAKVGAETAIDGSKNYIDCFNIEMSLVNVVEETIDGKTKKVYQSAVESHEPSEFSNDKTGEWVYYYQPTDTDNGAKDVSNNLFMLVVPGEVYYIKAVVYFNTVDEECDVDLLYATKISQVVQFTFRIQNVALSDVDIRNDEIDFDWKLPN